MEQGGRRKLVENLSFVDGAWKVGQSAAEVTTMFEDMVGAREKWLMTICEKKCRLRQPSRAPPRRQAWQPSHAPPGVYGSL